MANKTIPLKDKQLVAQRLAEGMSTRQAIKGTQITSNQTAARLAKEQSHVITQIREDYLNTINRYGAGRDYRAALLADMINATKYVRKPVPRYFHRAGWTEYGDELAEVPDWGMRLKAIKYIDQIAGITPTENSQINVLQQVETTQLYTD